MSENEPYNQSIDEETGEHRQSAFSRWSGIVLMVAVLGVAGILSALTAMRFAIRGREVVVPSLVGKTQADAEKMLAEKGLILKVSSKRFNPDIPEGQVVDQVPGNGSILKANRSVKVLISLGARKFAVPNLIGTSLRAAQLTLAQRRLALGNTLYTHTPEGDPSTVIYQSPQAGAQEGSDPSVHVLISLGAAEQAFIMPDLIGQSVELVSARAKTEGFRIAKLNYRKYPGVDSGLVIQQKPQAGYRLSKNDTILLDVSQ